MYRVVTGGLFFVLCISLLHVVQAQSTGFIEGTVVTARGDTPLPGVNVVVVGTLYGAVTDASGQFRVGPMPPASYTLQVNVLGYQPVSEVITVASGQEYGLTFRLQPLQVDFEEEHAGSGQRILGLHSKLDAGEIRSLNVIDTGQLLWVLPGLYGARRGARHFEPTLNGLTEDQVVQYVDGVRHISGVFPGFDTPIGFDDPSLVSEISNDRGPSVLSRSNGMSLLEVERTGESPAEGGLHGVLQTGYTSNVRSFDASGILVGQTGPLGYRLSGAYRTGKDYLDGQGERISAGFRSGQLGGQVGYRLTPSSQLVVQGSHHQQVDVALPGRLLDAPLLQTTQANARYQAAWTEGGVRQLEIQGQWSRIVQHLDDDQKPGRQGLALFVETAQDHLGGRVSAALAPVAGVGLEVGGEFYWANQEAAHRLDGPVGSEFTQRSMANRTEAGLFVLGSRSVGPVDAMVSMRFDAVNTNLDEGSSSILRAPEGGPEEKNDLFASGAVALTSPLSNRWRVAVSLSSASRAAAVHEFYANLIPYSRSHVVSSVQGNTGLKPERSTELVIGLRATYPRLKLDVSGFARRLSQFIVPTANPDLEGTYRYSNGTGLFYGIGSTATYDLLGEFVMLHMAGYYSWGKNETLEEPAFGMIPVSGALGVRLQAPANLFFLEGVLHLMMRQERVAHSLGEDASRGYTTADLRLGVTLPRSATLLLGFDNLTNRSYTHILNAQNPFTLARLPEPGRRFYIRLRMAF